VPDGAEHGAQKERRSTQQDFTICSAKFLQRRTPCDVLERWIVWRGARKTIEQIDFRLVDHPVCAI
jgi:hypothetical protein